WLQSLAGRQVALVLDTSYGGGVVEGKSLVVGLDVESQRVKDISQTNVVVLSSCAPDEKTPHEGGPNKVMWCTHCLVEVIQGRQEGRPLTLADAYRSARVKMWELFPRSP